MNSAPLIDENKCSGCVRCIEICPKDVLYLENKKARVKDENDCMLCSHCYDVCSAEAVSFSDLKNISFRTFPYNEKITPVSEMPPEMLVNIFRSRRSIRKFRDDKISDDVIKDLIEFSVTAPSASNCQYWEFAVVNGRDKVWALAEKHRDFFMKINSYASNFLIRNLSFLFMGKKLINYYRDHYETVEYAIKESEKGRDLLFHGAPAVIVIHGSDEGSMPAEDAAYASYNFSMLACSMNLGTCLIGFSVEALNRSPEMKRDLGIPDSNKIYSVIALGKPDVKFYKHSLRKKYNIQFV